MADGSFAKEVNFDFVASIGLGPPWGDTLAYKRPCNVRETRGQISHTKWNCH